MSRADTVPESAKVCACGATYPGATWSALQFCSYLALPPSTDFVELRICRECRSTIGVERTLGDVLTDVGRRLALIEGAS